MDEIPIISHNPKEEDIITPLKEYEYELKFKPRLNYPEICIVIFQKGLMDDFKKDLNLKVIDKLLGYELYLIEYKRKRFGLINFGIGAPLSALLLERLIVRGFKKFITIGISGSLKLDSKVGDICLCIKSVRDEGTSYHYLPPSKFVESSDILNNLIRISFDNSNIPYNDCISWTTDSGYKESKIKAKQYRKEGVSCIDMESAALFAVAKHRNIDLSSLFILSDFVNEDFDWNPKFHEDDKIKRSLVKIKFCLLNIIENI